ncbi:hypothetical protein ACWCQN_38355 [Streptomyces sp. NPDC001984]|uniref:hypothetical protein n=1 Tax=Streptomyces sp. NPDC002619 TaxID=3364655 RepID=UPI0036CE3DFB
MVDNRSDRASIADKPTLERTHKAVAPRSQAGRDRPASAASDTDGRVRPATFT